MQVFLLVLLASHLQSHSPCVFSPVSLSLFSFQSVLSLSPSPGRLFLFAQFPGWLCLPTVGFKSLPGRPASLQLRPCVLVRITPQLQLPSALLLYPSSFVSGQLFSILLFVASGNSERNSFLCSAPVVCNEKK